MKNIKRLLAALTLSIGIATFTPGTADAASCVIPGASTITDTGGSSGVHIACGKVVIQPVPGNPYLCFETWYFMELVDYYTDTTTAMLQTKSGNDPLPQTRLLDASSTDFDIESGWRTFSISSGLCVNRTSAKIGFSHVGNQGYKSFTPTWAP